MTPRLPDPRRYARAARHPLLEQVSSAPADDGRALVAVIAGMLDRAEDAEIGRALTLAPDRAAYARLWQALCAASEGMGEAGEALRTTVFALPLVIVSGARQGATIPGLLRDVDALAHVLRESGALGENRNFGVSAGLTSLETLERLSPSAVRAWRVAAGGARDIPSESIAIRAGEEVHLRFLLGAAITPAAAPSVLETAANIGSWGPAVFARAGQTARSPGCRAAGVAAAARRCVARGMAGPARSARRCIRPLPEQRGPPIPGERRRPRRDNLDSRGGFGRGGAEDFDELAVRRHAPGGIPVSAASSG
jgi:hypothetical protein